MSGTLCDECGATITELNTWPFCGGDPKKHAPVTHFGDDPIDDYIDGNLGPQDVHITTRGQRRQIMRENGIEYKRVDHKTRGKRLYFFT